MNKLVSRNPVLRFKLGRKIVKADLGTALEALGYAVGLHTPESKNGILRTPQITGDYVYTTGGRYGRMATLDEIDKSWGSSRDQVVSKYLDDVTNTVDDNGNLIKKTTSVPKKGRKLIERDGTEYWLGSDGSKTLLKKGTNSVINLKKTPINLKKTPIDWNQNYNNFKNGLTTALKAYLSKEGVDYDNAESVQKYLLRKLGNNALGKWGVDSKWGGASQAAWDKFAALTNFTPKADLLSSEQLEKDRQTVINLVLPKPVLPTIPKEGISNFTPLSTAKTYNKSDIRDYIRSKGFGAYDFTGSQRKALRMVMNGQGTDEDRAIVKAMGIFKQGGFLPSRNIVERFKQRNFRLVAQ